jgi:hypothetical protein
VTYANKLAHQKFIPAAKMIQSVKVAGETIGNVTIAVKIFTAMMNVVKSAQQTSGIVIVVATIIIPV